jgi:hypothetical protein
MRHHVMSKVRGMFKRLRADFTRMRADFLVGEEMGLEVGHNVERLVTVTADELLRTLSASWMALEKRSAGRKHCNFLGELRKKMNKVAGREEAQVEKNCGV